MIVAAVAMRETLPIVEEWQARVFDGYQRLHPRPYTEAPVRFIDLDDASLEKLGQWPWPRTLIAELVARLANAGASVVVFDIVFAEPDRTSPKQVLPSWPESPLTEELRARVDELPDHDQLFAELIGQANVVTGFVLTNEKGPRKPVRKGSVAYGGDDPIQYLPSFPGAVTNLPAIEAAAVGNGSFNLVPEPDGIVRRVPLLVRLAGEPQPYTSLSAEALRVAQGARTYIVKSSGASLEASFGAQSGIASIKIGRLEVPTDGQGRLWLHYTQEVPERTIPIWQVFEDGFDAARVENQIVLIGTSAAGLFDIRATPLNPATPGALIHVQAMEQMLTGHFLSRPDWANGVERTYLVLLGLLLVFLLPRFGAIGSAVVGTAGIALAVGASWYLFTEQRWLLDPIYASAVIVMVFIATTVLNFLRTENERRQVRGAFAQYLSPALVEQLAAEPDRLQLGGEMKEMTLLFCDLRGFTTISESFKSNPQGLTKLINKFLTPMTDIIMARQGTIDKYMGDCIMAFWNAPLDDPLHVQHACDSSLAMFDEMPKLNERLKAEAEAEGRPFHPLKVGIGLNTGEVVVGNMGSERRFDYSVLGDAVNLASRLEGQSKAYGVDVVIGELTQLQIPTYATMELDQIAVKGKKEAVRIFALLGLPAMRQDPGFAPWMERHNAMLAAYRAQKWDEVLALLPGCREHAKAVKPGGVDGFYDLYDERIDEFRENPPPPDWDGVYIATSK